MRYVIHAGCLALLLTLTSGSIAGAAEIDASVSSRETYVGVPVTLSVEVKNAEDLSTPEVPQADGLKIESLGAASTSSRITVINGRVERDSSSTLRFRITPLREGEFTVPAITFTVDGVEESTASFNLVATKSETGDVLFAEIVGKQPAIYVGEPLDLTLRVWIKPYRDRDYQAILSENDMWNLVSDDTQWGPFREIVESGQVTASEVLRPDSSGQSRNYYLYELNAKVYPQKPGQIEGDDVRIVLRYPTKLGKARDPFQSMFGDDGFPFPRSMFGDDLFGSAFRSRLAIESVRPVVADATVEPILVKPIPEDGRPDDYRGAVGRYQIATRAEPTSVKAGDPITLKIGIEGTGPMDLVQAPPLSELVELTRDFKVPDEPLAGISEGSQKVFTTSIRPRTANVTEIPPIPLSFFDPNTERFQTAYSKPIAISVEPAETLALDAIAGFKRSSRSGPDASESGTPPAAMFDNVDSNQALQQQATGRLITPVIGWTLAIPPMFVALILLVRTRGRASDLVGSAQSPIRQLRKRLDRAGSTRDIEAALGDFLVRRVLGQPDEAGADAAIGLLRRSGYGDAAIRFESLLSRCRRSEFTIEQSEQVNELRQQALNAAEDLQRNFGTMRRRIRRSSRMAHSSAAVERYRSKSASLVLAFGCSLWAASPAQAATEDRDALSASQTQTLLQEADALYEQGANDAGGDSAEHKLLNEKAAEKYQLVVDSGVRSAGLYFNLGNAYYQQGDIGRAIANYERALRIAPHDQRFQRHLDQARADVESPSATDDSAAGSVGDQIVTNVLRFVSPKLVLVTALVSWIALWIVILVRLLTPQVPWKTLSIPLALVVLMSGWVYADYVQRLSRSDLAVITAPEVPLRTGDGLSFPERGSLEQAVGRHVKVIDQRGDWANVETETGQTGWVPIDVVEII